MKKTILAVAVAASTFASVAQADGTTLFGSFRFAYTYQDLDDNGESSNIGNASSRFGISGENSLGNGLTAFYKYENRINETFNEGASLTTDQLYAGVAGSFGAVSVGTQTLPTDGMSNQSDPFNSLTPGSGIGEDNRDKTPNSLVYASPSWDGFSFEAAVVVNGAANSGSGRRSDVDAFNIGASYDANGFFAGLAFSDNTIAQGVNRDERQTIVGGLGYNNDTFGVGFFGETVVDAELNGKDTNVEPYFVRVSGFYNLNDVNAIYAGVGYEDQDTGNDDDQFFFSAGYQHDLSSNTRVWAEYGYTDAVNDQDIHAVSLGFRTDF